MSRVPYVSDLSSDSSPSATYVPPSDLEWQGDYSDVDTSDLGWQGDYSDVDTSDLGWQWDYPDVDTYAPPSDLEWQGDYSDEDAYVPPSDLEWQGDYSDEDTYVPSSDLEWQGDYSDVDTYVPPSDLEWQGDYSDEDTSDLGWQDAYAPPSDLGWQGDYSNSENEVYGNAAWLQTRRASWSWKKTFKHHTKQLDVFIDEPSLTYLSLAQRNAFDIVDSAVFIEHDKNEQCSDDQSEITSEESLVVEGKWIKHYNSYHRILLVGEGDFSFSASLAVAFGSAFFMIATSLDSPDFLKKNYKHAMSNIEKLRSRGCIVMHEIDATKIANHHFLGGKSFDRVIFNFPFAGFFKELSRENQLRKHRRLVRRFLKNAKEMMSENGEIHISHKTNSFHIEWNLESVASSQGLELIEAVEFNQYDYPNYNTKCGFGGNNNFNCSPSQTYKFGHRKG
ncbi:uncharacterized protein Fot_39688 [Forsythia ovata]|uniref:25S rRNA (uridine-N(3))-methyltransferase BMT5-like domain-containing protein n=1 Tax=Forsythia ovata TaxID=205694 RepID=A0ABD1S609_9LAMI